MDSKQHRHLKQAIAIRFFDGQTSRERQGRMYPSDDSGMVWVDLEGDSDALSFRLKDGLIRAAIGQTPPMIEFAHDVCIELLQMDLPDWLTPTDWTESRLAWLKRMWLGRIWRWESSPRWILVSVVVTIIFAVLVLQYGIPLIAKQTAYALPEHTLDDLGVSTLATLDHDTLKHSELPIARRIEIREEYKHWISANPEREIIFRQGGELGPNAFALPDGRIVVTDELVNLVANDYELLAVLAHETGHIERRHALRQSITNDSLKALIIAVTGNTTSLLNETPAQLVGLTYSREFEREADDYAYELMVQKELPLHYFSDILLRLETVGGGENDGNDSLKNGLKNYISTHPPTSERIARFEGHS
ncbi:M48 family metallopeptidase [Aquirhabdus parva]|uniref:Peptidase M48 domain-containing protein n=1 Tax=Aquirhabdus parva TaxID=2283318 RepID=A0A345P338_9GAMM|nr:M48 family metallopeptidase [Aquirhabdus parva]AXI01697.1 hypothetical protein HYN46_01595 [Aquirhabdus parva]